MNYLQLFEGDSYGYLKPGSERLIQMKVNEIINWINLQEANKVTPPKGN